MKLVQTLIPVILLIIVLILGSGSLGDSFTMPFQSTTHAMGIVGQLPAYAVIGLIVVIFLLLVIYIVHRWMR